MPRSILILYLQFFSDANLDCLLLFSIIILNSNYYDALANEHYHKFSLIEHVERFSVTLNPLHDIHFLSLFHSRSLQSCTHAYTRAHSIEEFICFLKRTINYHMKRNYETEKKRLVSPLLIAKRDNLNVTHSI